MLAVTELQAGKPNEITDAVHKHCPGASIVDGKDKSDYVVLLTFTWGPVGKTTSYLLFTRVGENLAGDSPVSLDEALAQSCAAIRKHLRGESLPEPRFPAFASGPPRVPRVAPSPRPSALASPSPAASPSPRSR